MESPGSITEQNEHDFGSWGRLYGYGAKSNQVTSFWKEKLETEVDRFWERFYRKNKTSFFKDRHWLLREFPHLATRSSDLEKINMMEVGCGVGNTVFPLLEENPDLFIYAFDFSPKAIELVKENENFNEKRCCAFVCDITKNDLPSTVSLNSINFATMIFVLSAISPEYMSCSLQRLWKVMKPGGIIFFRDYAVNDMAQVRFEEDRNDKEPNKLSENFYVRGDGTRAYYFSKEILEELFSRNGYQVIESHYVNKEVQNRKEEKHMNRVFIQGQFQK